MQKHIIYTTAIRLIVGDGSCAPNRSVSADSVDSC
jgi:hypothetical protein